MTNHSPSITAILNNADMDLMGKVSALRDLRNSLDFWTDADERNQADSTADYICIHGTTPS